MKFIRFISLIMVCLTAFSAFGIIGAAEDISAYDVDTFQPLKGKTLSVLGDSISTFENVSNGKAASTTNSTIKDNVAYYTSGKTNVTLEKTWWKQVEAKTGMRILVNNSYSNSDIFDPKYKKNNVGYLSRAVNLHDNTGDNAGEKPDIVAVYLGTNDVSKHSSHLGLAEDINYKKLIKKSNGKTTYAKPTTVCEAYAVMIHKIKSAYPKAEIYCFNILPRRGATDEILQAISDFNDSIRIIAGYFDVGYVDLNRCSGITSTTLVNNRYLHDKLLHPNKKGMSAIASAFIDELNRSSKYTSSVKCHNIKYDLKDVIVNEGTLKSALNGNGFSCSFSKLKYGDFNVSVTMGEKDITSACYSGGKIKIPSVTGNVRIKASLKSISRTVNNYRYETKKNKLINIVKNENTENTMTLNKKGSYTFTNNINLYYDKSWILAFRLYDLDRNIYKLLSSTDENGYTVTLNTKKNILAISKNSSDYMYGINLSNSKIDYTKPHTYKIANKYTTSGTNTFYVYIDGALAGELNTRYTKSYEKVNSKSLFYEDDFNFSTIGSNKYPLSLDQLKYIQIWETEGKSGHVHKYSYTIVKKATCETPKATHKICDCSYKQTEYSGKALGHDETAWYTKMTATVYAPGKAEKLCRTCGKITATKKLKQLICGTPGLSNIKNVESGIKISWKKVAGADSYKVYRKTSKTNWKYLKAVTSQSFTDTAVKGNNGKKYIYTVKACNEAGAGKYESGISIKCVSAPHLLKLTNTTKGIYIKWESVKGADSYRIYKKTKDGWKYLKSAKSTHATDTNAVKYSGKTFKYTVVAVNDDVISGYESGLSIKFVATPKIKNAVNTEKGIKISFSSVKNADEYKIYRKSANGNWKAIGNTTKTSFTDKSVAESYGKKYTYTVRAFDGKSYSSRESGVTIKRSK